MSINWIEVAIIVGGVNIYLILLLVVADKLLGLSERRKVWDRLVKLANEAEENRKAEAAAITSNQ